MGKRCAIAFFALAAVSMGQPSQDSLIGQARFIFQGTVQKLHSSNVATLPASERTIVVRVDTVLRAPRTLDNFAGRDVTVYLKSSLSPKPGQQAIFFTNGWLYGQNLAVREVAQQTLREADALKSRIRQFDAGAAQTELLARLRPATLVIEGRVRETSAATPPKPGLHSEHAPDWWVAKVQVLGVEKGQAAEQVISVYFPASTDEMWYRSPKFSPGQEGIFVLQMPSAEAYGFKGYTALHPLDFQPLSERDPIRRLVQQIR
jgi:hypothetical protein